MINLLVILGILYFFSVIFIYIIFESIPSNEQTELLLLLLPSEQSTLEVHSLKFTSNLIFTASAVQTKAVLRLTQTKVMDICLIALHEMLSDDLASSLADHTPQSCIVCNPEAFSEDEV